MSENSSINEVNIHQQQGIPNVKANSITCTNNNNSVKNFLIAIVILTIIVATVSLATLIVTILNL